MLKDLHRLLPPGLAAEFKQWINRPENFLKHADKDPDRTYDLDRRWTESLMWDASRKYCELAGECRPLMAVFILWFVVNYGVASELLGSGIGGPLPALLDVMIEALRDGNVDDGTIRRRGAEHGHSRRLSDYSVEQLTWEFAIFRALLRETLEQIAPSVSPGDLYDTR